MTIIAATVSAGRRGQAGSNQIIGNPRQVDAACNAGIIVCQGASDGSVKAPASAANVAAAIGALLYDPSVQKKTDAQTTDFAAGNMATVVERGPMYLYSETAMTRGGVVHCRYAAGAGGTELGVVRNAAVTDETAQLPNAYVVKSTSGAGPVQININLPST